MGVTMFHKVVLFIISFVMQKYAITIPNAKLIQKEVIFNRTLEYYQAIFLGLYDNK